MSQVETLFGHQDVVADISALAGERCLTVGSRDRTAVVWKIADESRLTFRGGDIKDFPEGSIDCCSMIDSHYFVTGSDNGSICLWSLSKKKPVFIERRAHGVEERPETDLPHTGEAEADKVPLLPNLPDTLLQSTPSPTQTFSLPDHGVERSRCGSWDPRCGLSPRLPLCPMSRAWWTLSMSVSTDLEAKRFSPWLLRSPSSCESAGSSTWEEEMVCTLENWSCKHVKGGLEH